MKAKNEKQRTRAYACALGLCLAESAETSKARCRLSAKRNPQCLFDGIADLKNEAKGGRFRPQQTFCATGKFPPNRRHCIWACVPNRCNARATRANSEQKPASQKGCGASTPSPRCKAWYSFWAPRPNGAPRGRRECRQPWRLCEKLPLE